MECRSSINGVSIKGIDRNLTVDAFSIHDWESAKPTELVSYTLIPSKIVRLPCQEILSFSQ